MNGKFLFKNKIFWVTDERNYEAFPYNNGYPTAITTNVGTYSQWFWRIYKRISGVRVEQVIEPASTNVADAIINRLLNKKNCYNCVNKDDCINISYGSDSGGTIKSCFDNEFNQWLPRFLCADSHDPAYNNCEDLMGGSCTNSQNITICNKRVDLLESDKKSPIVNNESINDIKKIRDIFK